MASNSTAPRGVQGVVFMALSKREFFAHLLASPADALTPEVRELLDLTEADVAEVEGMIGTALKGITSDEALVAWDQWRDTGTWTVHVMSWPITG